MKSLVSIMTFLLINDYKTLWNTVYTDGLCSTSIKFGCDLMQYSLSVGNYYPCQLCCFYSTCGFHVLLISVQISHTLLLPRKTESSYQLNNHFGIKLHYLFTYYVIHVIQLSPFLQRGRELRHTAVFLLLQFMRLFKYL